MIILKSIIQTVLCILIVSLSFDTKAQSPASNPEYYYVEIKSITVDSYVSLHNTLKNDGTYEIKSACIPAHVLKIRKISGTQDLAAFSQNFDLLSIESGLTQITVLPNYSDEKFVERCSTERSSGQ